MVRCFCRAHLTIFLHLLMLRLLPIHAAYIHLLWNSGPGGLWISHVSPVTCRLVGCGKMTVFVRSNGTDCADGRTVHSRLPLHRPPSAARWLGPWRRWHTQHAERCSLKSPASSHLTGQHQPSRSCHAFQRIVIILGSPSSTKSP